MAYRSLAASNSSVQWNQINGIGCGAPPGGRESRRLEFQSSLEERASCLASEERRGDEAVDENMPEQRWLLLLAQQPHRRVRMLGRALENRA
jgi:hypothetical protein